MKESDLERDARLLVETNGGRLVKIRAVGIVGFPDRLALMPNGKCAYIEFKKPGKRPRRNQFAWLNFLRSNGYEAFWTDRLSDVEAWVIGADPE